MSANKKYVLKDTGSKTDIFGKSKVVSFSGAWIVANGSANLFNDFGITQEGQCDVVEGTILGVEGLTHHLTCSFNKQSNVVFDLGSECSILHIARDFDVQKLQSKNATKDSTSPGIPTDPRPVVPGIPSPVVPGFPSR